MLSRLCPGVWEQHQGRMQRGGETTLADFMLSSLPEGIYQYRLASVLGIRPHLAVSSHPIGACAGARGSAQDRVRAGV